MRTRHWEGRWVRTERTEGWRRVREGKEWILDYGTKTGKGLRNRGGCGRGVSWGYL
jgi:hypothetical protein